MSLLQKSLLFLSIILMLQLALFSVLAISLVNAEKQADRLAYSHRVVSGRDRISHAFYESMQAIMLMAITANKSLGTRLDQIAKELPVTIKEMENSEYATAEDQADLSKISNITMYLIDELRFLRNSITDSSTPDRFRQSLRFITLQVNPHLSDLNEAMASLEHRHRNIERNLSNNQQLRNLTHITIVAGFLASISATIAVVFGFVVAVTNRIKLVVENMLRYAEGKPLHAKQSGRDEITVLDRQFHNLSKNLSESKAKDDAVFANMPVGLIVCLEDGTVEHLNPQAKRLFAFTDTAVLKVQNFLGEKTADGNLPLHYQASTQGEPKRVSCRRTDGSQFPAEMSIAKFTHDGTDRALLAILDVSDREHIEKLRQEFVAIVSHDICTPLSSISACLTLFLQGVFGAVSERGQQRLHVAENECRRLMRLTNDLLDIARIESGHVHLEKTSCRVEELMELSIYALQFDASRHGIELLCQPTDLVVLADADRVAQILINFLSNAIKYAPDSEYVMIKAELVQENVRISVIDKGPGIPKMIQEQIFERFSQAKLEDRTKGTGLGLAVCRMLAEAHGGTVGVISEEGKGSTFWVNLPRFKTP